MPCPRCAEQGHDLIACPYVKALEFDPAYPGIITRVEFLTPADHFDGEKQGAEPGGADEPQSDYPRKGTTGG